MISSVKLQIIRKEGKQNTGENKESGSVVHTDVLKNAEDSARGVRKPETRNNTTYEVLPKSHENTCGYLIILFFRKKWGSF